MESALLHYGFRLPVLITRDGKRALSCTISDTFEPKDIELRKQASLRTITKGRGPHAAAIP